MPPDVLRVVLDTNVLFQAPIRDAILRAVEFGRCEVYWSEQILEELRRSLRRGEHRTAKQVARLLSRLREEFPKALTTDYESLIPALKNHQDDRHVAAVALKAGAQVIVTENLKDFQPLPEGLSAQSADDFLCRLLARDESGMVGQIRGQIADLYNPSLSPEVWLHGLAEHAPQFAAALRPLLQQPPSRRRQKAAPR